MIQFDCHRNNSTEVKLEPLPAKAGLLRVFKALADENRLKILGLLSQNPHTGDQLATLLALRPSTISHHLTKLRQAGLVSAEAAGYYSVYRLEANSLAEVARRLESRETLADLANSVYERAFARMQQPVPRHPHQKRKSTAG
jgi:DNA-binding transcriptional ArsR family regulator